MTETQIIKTEDVFKVEISRLDAFQNAKEKQLELVKTSPYTEIADSKLYEIAKKHRTALRTARTDLEKGQKAIFNVVNTFKSEVTKYTDELINITRPTEDRQQSEITRYENEKEEEKRKKEEEERHRVELIRKSIMDFRNRSNQSIASATFNTIEGIQKDIQETMIPCSEFQEDFEAIKNDLVRTVDQKRIQLQEVENIRIVQLEIARDRSRSIELRKYDYIYPGEDLGKISETDFLEIREDQRKVFQEIQSAKSTKEAADKAERDRIESENKAEREKLEAEREKLEAEKARIERDEYERKYKIRVEALLAIGLEKKYGGYYSNDNYDSVAIHSSNIREDSDDIFLANIELVKKRMIEQDQEKKEKIERDAKEKIEREIAERARQESLKPDKQKIIETLTNLTLPEPDLSSPEMQEQWDMVRESFRCFVIKQITIIDNL